MTPWLRTPYRLLRGASDLRLLLGAGLVSTTGDWLLGTGLTYAVFAITGSTLVSALTLLAAFVPQVLVGSVAGVFVDRWDRRRTMVATNLVLAAALLPLVLVGAVDRIWLVYLVLAAESAVEVFFTPAEQAMLPLLVADEDLVVANGLNGQLRQVARLVGSGLGGVVAALGGITAVAAVDGATFLVAALLVSRVGTPGRAVAVELSVPDEAVPDAVRGRVAQLGHEWRAGLATAWASRVVRVLLAFALVTCTGEGIMATLFAPYVRDVLHSGAEIYGLVTGVQAIGGILGGFVVVGLGERWSPVTMLGVGAMLFGLVDLAIFLYPLLLVSPWPAVAGMILVGLPGAVTMAGYQTLFQRGTVDESRGRVFGLVALAQSVAVVVGTVGAGLLGQVVGIVPVLAVQGVGYVAAGLLVLSLLRHGGPSVGSAAPPTLTSARS